ncbi:MAG: SusC/RagA family TonB-linked outer membrane protein [Bacteroides sp.]|nr:SusC/RagA family TonB-linked outer membrane protein [Bacteroides sp.]
MKCFSRLLLLMVCAILTLNVSAQTRKITGTVTDDAGDPMAGVSVMIKGTNQGTATNVDGKYTLHAAPGSVIEFSYIGYLTKSVTIGERSVINITMNEDVKALDEVVIVAYGAQKKSSITGAITQIGSETIEKRPITTVTAALEGTTPGLTTTANYGAPGESSSIQIRGISTVNGDTSPLYVVDGIPYPGSISDINPDDVQSISVLKDAASAALYGNRAANGVILITTKKAKSERTQITFKTTQGFYNRGMKDYKTTNVNQWMNVAYQDMLSTYVNTQGISRTDVAGMAAANEYVRNNFVDGFAFINIFNADNDKLFDANGNFLNHSIQSGYTDDLDWFDQAERTGYRGEYYLSGSGATDKSDYFFSLGYLSEDGYMTDASFDRISGRTAVNLTPVKWLKTGFSIAATHSKTSSSMNGVGDGNDKVNNPFLTCRTMAPIYAVHAHNPWTGEYLYENGQKIYNLGHLDGYELYNPATGQTEKVEYIQVNNRTLDRNVIYESEMNSDKTIKNTMNAIAYADFNLPYGFVFSLKGNLSTRNMENTVMGSSKIGDYVGKHGQLDKYTYNYKNWTFLQQLRWNGHFGKNTFEVLLGHENYSYMYDYTSATKISESFPNIPALSNYSEMTSISGNRTRYRTESYLARVQYNYDDRYNLEASFRRDASSRFAKDVRWGNFGSVGANWVFTNEDFMKNYTWISNGKLRADWGQVGQDSGAGSYYASFAKYVNTVQNGQAAYYISTNAAPNLKWETAESWGIAIEGRLFNRWNLSLEYYDKRNKDLIFNVYSPISQGTTAINSTTSNSSTSSVNTMNLGTVANRGIEITTDVDIFTNKDWSINLAANLSTLSNKVTKLPEQNKDGIDNTTQYIKEGKSRYEFYTRTYRGVDLVTGQALYDLDFAKYHIVSSDGQIIGGTQKVENGKPVVDDNGKPVYSSTATTKYVYIDGKYYSTDYDQAERSFKGHAMPSVFGSFTPSIRFRDFNFSMMIYYSLGGQIYDSPYRNLLVANGNPGNHHVDALKSWKEVPAFLLNADGTANTAYTGADRISTSVLPEFSSATSTHNNAASDRWLVSADYWQIKNINLTYTLPRRLTSSWGIDLVRLSFSAENLYTHTKRQGINPMMSMSGYQYNYMVPARVFTFGLNVNI